LVWLNLLSNLHRHRPGGSNILEQLRTHLVTLREPEEGAKTIIRVGRDGRFPVDDVANSLGRHVSLLSQSVGRKVHGLQEILK
jgi:hypothetical protein